MNTQQEDQDATQNSAYDPFPEPQTIPSGWDTTTLCSQPQSGSDMDKDDPAED
jgi:hypothetical protein